MIEARSDLVFQIPHSMQDKLVSRPDEECQICCEKLIKKRRHWGRKIYNRANTETNNTEKHRCETSPIKHRRAIYSPNKIRVAEHHSQALR